MGVGHFSKSIVTFYGSKVLGVVQSTYALGWSKKPGVSFPLELSKVLYIEFLFGVPRVPQGNFFRTRTFFGVFPSKDIQGFKELTARSVTKVISRKYWLNSYYAVERKMLISLSLQKSIYLWRDPFARGGGGGWGVVGGGGMFNLMIFCVHDNSTSFFRAQSIGQLSVNC